jgi:BirA family transcriptional regulator, biotin operon repressor / biotin---[acetyl-CoA-carboxylase] ligase
MDVSMQHNTNPEALLAQLKASLDPAGISDIKVVETIASTNTELMQRDFLDHPREGAMLWALTQASGRGRRGRVWQSHPEHALTFSISYEAEIREDSKLASLSPAVGLHLAIAFSTLSAGIQVKWPNDLWREGRKIAGVLLEATQRGKIQRVVIGVGINLFWPNDQQLALNSGSALPKAAMPQTPGGMFDQPASLEQKIQILTASVRVIGKLHADLQNPKATRQQWFQHWSAFDALADQEVSIYQDQEVIASGINAGVDVDGVFLLKPSVNPTAAEGLNVEPKVLRRFEIGEVSMRAATGAHTAPKIPVKITP